MFPVTVKAMEIADLDGYSVDIHPIGKGAFGRVYKVRKDDTGELYAMKVVEKSHQNYKKVKDEIVIHQLLKHPNIVNVVASFDTAKQSVVVMELCGTNLYDYQKEKGGKIFWVEAKKIMLDACRGVQYMHQLGYSHRDIKPENILQCGDVWKIIDFGFSSKSTDMHWEVCCTIDYLAPESMGYNYLGNPTDVWSLGVVLYEMLYGNPPFFAPTIQKTYELIRKGEVKYSRGDALDVLIKDMLNVDPNTRIQIGEVISRLEKL